MAKDPVILQIVNVWIKSIIPIANGCFICIKVNPINKDIIIIKYCKISESSLIKILILEINDRKIFSFSEVLKEYILILIYKTNVFIKLLKLMIIFVYWIFPIFLFLFGVLVFVINSKHLLIILLSLEFIVLRLFLFLFIYLSLFNYERFFRIIFLTFCVCEGALGLSILVSLIRTHGNDYFNSFSVLQC